MEMPASRSGPFPRAVEAVATNKEITALIASEAITKGGGCLAASIANCAGSATLSDDAAEGHLIRATAQHHGE